MNLSAQIDWLRLHLLQTNKNTTSDEEYVVERNQDTDS